MNIEINKSNITLEKALEHGISSEEWEKIKAHLGRTPNFTELGIFSAMWNEHCSYKSSKIHLKKSHFKNALRITFYDWDPLFFSHVKRFINIFCCLDFCVHVSTAKCMTCFYVRLNFRFL